MDCSTGFCTNCGNGWSFDADSNICTPCGPNCLTCTSPNFVNCLSCIPGTYLTGTSCLPCDYSCVTCSGTATTCTICRPGLALAGSICTGSCPRNCITCSNATTCTVCQNGFILANGNCRGCASSCSSCNATNITQCTSCASGLSLFKSKCVPCPTNCLTCNNNSCSVCIPGMTPNSAGVCVLSCQIPCATCVDNQPTQCTSCYSGASLSNFTCTFDYSCNNDNSCTDCGAGFGYVLASTNCIQCSSIDNCIQCNEGDTESCSLCMNGYYVDADKTCTQCAANCNLCLSGDVCTACASGYTLASTQGQCIACASPCLTCQGSSSYCLSCVDGYNKKSWKCQPNKFVNFVYVLNIAPATFLSGVDAFITALLVALGENSTNTDVITIDTATNGSTIVGGTVSPSTNVSLTTATALISSATSVNGTIGGFPVTSVSVSVEGSSSTA